MAIVKHATNGNKSKLKSFTKKELLFEIETISREIKAWDTIPCTHAAEWHSKDKIIHRLCLLYQQILKIEEKENKGEANALS